MRHITAVTCAAFLTLACTCASAGSENVVPYGWRVVGAGQDNYAINRDPADKTALVIQRVSPPVGNQQYASLTQRISAQSYEGGRIEFSGDLRTDSVGIANLWVRIDGQKEKLISLTNLGASAPKGTTGWQHYSVVVDVPTSSSAIAYGVLLRGSGELKVRNLAVAPVGKEVTATTPIQIPPGSAMPETPVNLNFN